MLNPKSSQAPWLTRLMLRGLIWKTNKRWKPGEDYLIAHYRAGASIAGWGSLWLTALGLGLLSWEVTRISCITTEGVFLKAYFSSETTHRPWDTAVKLTTGCNPRGEEKPLHYTVFFGDGFSYDLGHGDLTAMGMDRLAALDRIDQELRKRDVPWEPGVFVGGMYKGQTLWNPACFEHHWRKLEPAEREKFERVYRCCGRISE